MNPPPAAAKKYPLATWLSAGSLAIVFVALAIMAVVSSVVVDRFAHRQALARSELAVSSAREYFRRLAESNLVATRALAENATLVRLLDDPASLTLGLFLRNYCTTAHATHCLVSTAQGIVAASANTISWPEVAAAHAEQGERFAYGPKPEGSPLLGAAVAVAQRPEYSVVMLQALSDDLVREAGRQSGADISLQNINSYHAPVDDPLTHLHAAALTNGDHAAARIAALDRYVASAVMINAAGEPVALLDAQFPTAEFDRSAATYRRVVLWVSLLVAALAGLAGLLSGRWLAAPVVRLADMARRIGQGDFSPAVPTVVPRELDALAHAMDEMRQNLVELTATLRRREAEAQAVLAGVVEGVFVTDEQRVIVYANPQFVRTVAGASPGVGTSSSVATSSSVTGRFCGDVLHPHLEPAARPCEHDCPIVKARAQGTARAAETLRRADGSGRSTLVISAAPADGRQVQLLRDETDLEAVRRARDSVLGNISHEFRTPLAAQLASIEMLRDGINTLAPAEQHELLANVERGVLRLMRLIDNLLESVRIESGQLRVRRQNVDLPTIAHEATELLRPLLAQTALHVDIHLQAVQDRPLPGDAQRLQQVLVNLLSNAVKFAPPGSTIIIGAQVRGTVVDLWVEDAGPGLPAGEDAAIFERFRRGSGAEPDAPGLGLGLWIVRSIVERHAGSVRVERTDESRTRFVVTLPLTSAAEEPA